MNFLDKLTKVTNKILDKVEENVEKANKTYQQEGLSAVVEKTINKVNNNLDKAAEKIVQYYEDAVENKRPTTQEKNSNPNNNTQPQRKLYLQEILDDGQLATLNYTPLEIVLEELKATKSVRLPGHYKTARGNAIQLVHNKWYSFNGVGDEGAINFVKYVLNGEKTVSLKDKSLDQALTNDALQLLEKLHKTPDYQQRLSTWIKVAQKNKIRM